MIIINNLITIITILFLILAVIVLTYMVLALPIFTYKELKKEYRKDEQYGRDRNLNR